MRLSLSSLRTFFWALGLIAGALFTRVGIAQEARVLDEIVAVVGDYIILKSDVDGFVLGVVQQQQIPSTESLWGDALDQLINDKVLVIHAKRDTNLTVTDAQVDQMLDSRISQMSAQFGGETRLEELYGRSVIEIKAELREEFRDQLLADQLRNTKLRTIKATPSDVQNWFSQFPSDSLPTLPDIVRIAHIVRKPFITDEAKAEAMEIISTIRDSVVTGGGSIQEMARLFSDDPGSAENGGLYEGTTLSELVSEFAAVASRVPLGTFSQIFETVFGLHFLRVNARRGDVIDYNHILIAFDERKSDPTDAIAVLHSVRDSILTMNVSFEKLARVHSEDERSSVRGGRVTDPQTGERNLYIEQLGPTWQRTLIGMKEDEISEPGEVTLIDGSRAYHIIWLQKRIPSHRVDVETDYEMIQQLALRQKQGQVMQRWLESLKDRVYIQLRGKARDLSLAGN